MKYYKWPEKLTNLVYDFKGSTPSVNFSIFGGPMYTYNQLKNDEKSLQ